MIFFVFYEFLNMNEKCKSLWKESILWVKFGGMKVRDMMRFKLILYNIGIYILFMMLKIWGFVLYFIVVCDKERKNS